METIGTITKGILMTIGRIIKFSILLVIAIIVSLLVIANAEGVIEGIALIFTWTLFTFANRSKTKKEKKEEE